MPYWIKTQDNRSDAAVLIEEDADWCTAVVVTGDYRPGARDRLKALIEHQVQRVTLRSADGPSEFVAAIDEYFRTSKEHRALIGGCIAVVVVVGDQIDVAVLGDIRVVLTGAEGDERQTRLHVFGEETRPEYNMEAAVQTLWEEGFFDGLRGRPIRSGPER